MTGTGFVDDVDEYKFTNRDYMELFNCDELDETNPEYKYLYETWLNRIETVRDLRKGAWEIF